MRPLLKTFILYQGQLNRIKRVKIGKGIKYGKNIKGEKYLYTRGFGDYHFKKNNLNNDNNETRKFHSKSIKYPKPTPSFQRKLNILPERSNRFNPNEYLSTCFACDLGCSVSRSGYSPMTYSPYNKKNKRRDITPYK